MSPTSETLVMVTDMLSNYRSVAWNTVLTVFPDDSRSRCRIIMIHGIKYGLVEELWKSNAADRS